AVREAIDAGQISAGYGDLGESGGLGLERFDFGGGDGAADRFLQSAMRSDQVGHLFTSNGREAATGRGRFTPGFRESRTRGDSNLRGKAETREFRRPASRRGIERPETVVPRDSGIG